MREFTEADVKNETHIYTDYSGGESKDLIYAPLKWQTDGLQQTASGYGQKLVTRWKIRFEDKTYRLYCTQFSNAGSI